MTLLPHLPVVLLLALLLGPGDSARADLTLVGRSTLSAMNMPNTGKETLYVKKKRLRRDLTDRGRFYSYLYDLDKKEITSVDHFQRLAQVHPLTASNTPKATTQELQLELTATGRNHALGAWNCEEYGLQGRTPAELGQEKVTVLLTGQVWLARKIPELKEIAPFIKAVEADDFFIGTTAPGKPVSSQTRGINETMRQVLTTGMLCAAEIQLKYEGSGPMADLGRRMATRVGIVYESLSKVPLGDDTFEVPAGYRVVRR